MSDRQTAPDVRNIFLPHKNAIAIGKKPFRRFKLGEKEEVLDVHSETPQYVHCTALSLWMYF